MKIPGDFKIKDYQKKIINQMNDILTSGKKIILQRPRCNGRIMSRHYFLNPDHTYRPCDLMTWVRQFESEDRKVADNTINCCRIFTVWVGRDHNYFGGAPLVFKTMVFKSDGLDIYCMRYTTWDQALEGHKEAMAWVIDGCKEENE